MTSERVEGLEKLLLSRPDLQPWDRHTRLRLSELQVFRHEIAAARPPTSKRLLEVGCGNAIGTAYLAELAEECIATDLAAENPVTHSIGLKRAEELLRAVGAHESRVLACSGESLPFQPDTFDISLAVYSLEHVPDKPRCLQEIRRVLADRGVVAISVPAFAWGLFLPVYFYSYLLRRLVGRLISRTASGAARSSRSSDQVETTSRVKSWSTFKAAYPHFPRPSPHGAYRSYSEELRGLRLSRWIGLCEDAGFRVVQIRSLGLIPRGLLVGFLGSVGEVLSEWLLPLDRRLSRVKRLRSIAQYVLIICVKDPA